MPLKQLLKVRIQQPRNNESKCSTHDRVIRERANRPTLPCGPKLPPPHPTQIQQYYESDIRPFARHLRVTGYILFISFPFMVFGGTKWSAVSVRNCTLFKNYAAADSKCFINANQGMEDEDWLWPTKISVSNGWFFNLRDIVPCINLSYIHSSVESAIDGVCWSILHVLYSIAYWRRLLVLYAIVFLDAFFICLKTDALIHCFVYGFSLLQAHVRKWLYDQRSNTPENRFLTQLIEDFGLKLNYFFLQIHWT